MSFWTFFLYLIGALVLMRVIGVLFVLVLASIINAGNHPDYGHVPTYASSATQTKEFPDHQSGDLAKKLGDLS